SVAAALVELLDLSARLLGPDSVPGITGAKPDRLLDQIERDELAAGDDDVGDLLSGALDDGNDDVRVRPVVPEGRARRPTPHRSEALSAQVLPADLHIAGQLLLDVETAEDADGNEPGWPRLHLIL